MCSDMFDESVECKTADGKGSRSIPRAENTRPVWPPESIGRSRLVGACGKRLNRLRLQGEMITNHIWILACSGDFEQSKKKNSRKTKHQQKEENATTFLPPPVCMAKARKKKKRNGFFIIKQFIYQPRPTWGCEATKFLLKKKKNSTLACLHLDTVQRQSALHTNTA